jgi:hypothetical protein
MSYYDKYLKYKSKYLEYKNSIGGAAYIPSHIRQGQPQRLRQLVIDRGSGATEKISYNAGDILWWNDKPSSFLNATKEFKISQNSRHIFKIVNCDIINKLNKIDPENYIICIHYNNNPNDYKDIQLGITETPKMDESENENTAQRGIYEEVGILFNKDLLTENKIECSFTPIKNISQYDSYIININNNLHQIIDHKLHTKKFSTKSDDKSNDKLNDKSKKKAFIILYGTIENLEEMLKQRAQPKHEMYDNPKAVSIQNEINIYNNQLSIIIIKKDKFIKLAQENSKNISNLEVTIIQKQN